MVHLCVVLLVSMCSVALKHEILVNKDLKTTIVCSSKGYLDRVLFYYPVRSMVLNTLKRAVLLDFDDTKSGKVFLILYSSL